MFLDSSGISSEGETEVGLSPDEVADGKKAKPTCHSSQTEGDSGEQALLGKGSFFQEVFTVAHRPLFVHWYLLPLDHEMAPALRCGLVSYVHITCDKIAQVLEEDKELEAR